MGTAASVNRLTSQEKVSIAQALQLKYTEISEGGTSEVEIYDTLTEVYHIELLKLGVRDIGFISEGSPEKVVATATIENGIVDAGPVADVVHSAVDTAISSSVQQPVPFLFDLSREAGIVEVEDPPDDFDGLDSKSLPMILKEETMDHAIITDIHPSGALLRTKTSAELLAAATSDTLDQTEKVSSFISQLKSGDIAMRTPTTFRARRLTMELKTAEQPEPKTPDKKMSKRTTIYASSEIGVKQETTAPFHPSIMGTYSCHGIEPDPEEEDGIHEKINQDRGCVVFPFHAKSGVDEALFVVLDGHGEQGDRVAEFVMRQLVISLEKHVELESDPPIALKETFIKTNAALMVTDIRYMTSGCTCVAVFVSGRKIYVANAGDSRAVMGISVGNTIVAHNLSRDHKPDVPEERARILAWGGFVSESPEPGLSSRVYLNPELTMIGLAMSRSIGDYAVKSVGVIPEPEVTEFDLADNHKFMILASDGVWEFISSQEAVDIVSRSVSVSANAACEELIGVAKSRWEEEEGDYRDDITAIVVTFPLPFQAKNCFPESPAMSQKRQTKSNKL